MKPWSGGKKLTLKVRRQRMLKYGFNDDDGLVGQQIFAGEATRLAYGTEEAEEGRNSFVEKKKRFSSYPWQY